MKIFFRMRACGYWIYDNWRRNKRWYICMIATVILGIILGILFAANNRVIIISTSARTYFVIGQSISIGNVLLQRLIFYLVPFVLIVLCCFTCYLIPVTFMVLLLKAYHLGVLLVLCFAEFGLVGFILVLLILLPTQLVFLTLLAALSVQVASDCFFCRRYAAQHNVKFLCTFGAISFGICFLVTLVECLLLGVLINPIFF